MSFFKENYTTGVLQNAPKLYFLNEQRNIVQEHEAVKFVVKKKTDEGFKEFFGTINNPNSKDIPKNTPVPNLPELFEGYDDLYNLYGLNEPKIVHAEEKDVPVFIPKTFLELTPNTFAGIPRDKEKIAQDANKRRGKIYDFYRAFIPGFVSTVTEVKATSIADLYEYLNDGEHWEEGMELYGWCDGLWETGGYITVTIDTSYWDLHTAIHEMFHSISYYFNDTLFEEWYKIATDTSEAPPTDYAKTEVSEDIAETGAFYFMNGNERKFLKEKCPKRYMFMKHIEQLNREALVQQLYPTKELSKRFMLYDKIVYNQ